MTDGAHDAVNEPEAWRNLVTLAPGVRVAPGALRFTFARSGGPGGQNVNKVASKAVLEVAWADLAGAMPAAALDRLTDQAGRYVAGAGDERKLLIAAEDSRSQAANRRACLAKLRHVIAEAMRRPTPRKKTRPSAGSVRRRLDAKRHRSQLKRRRQTPGGEE